MEGEEFSESIVQRLERIARALEKSANVALEDLEFRQKAAQEQAELVQRLTAPAPQIEGRRARRA